MVDTLVFMFDKRSSDKKRADKNRAEIAAYKVEHGCIDCGYNANPLALEFDHLPGSVKRKTVASMMYSAPKLIYAEIAKCEVVCANCHAIRTMGRMGGPK